MLIWALCFSDRLLHYGHVGNMFVVRKQGVKKRPQPRRELAEEMSTTPSIDSLSHKPRTCTRSDFALRCGHW